MKAWYSENDNGIYDCVSIKVNWDLIRRITVYPRFFTLEDGLVFSTDKEASFAVPKCTFSLGLNHMRKYISKLFPNAKVVFDFSGLEKGIDISPNRGRVTGSIVGMLENIKAHNGVWGADETALGD